MKEDLKLQLRGVPQARGLSFVREYLQAAVLESLQRAGAMVPLAFQGGTALRFLYSIRRYSEDLDFALERPGRGDDFKAYLRAIQSGLLQEGYTVEIKASNLALLDNALHQSGWTGPPATAESWRQLVLDRVHTIDWGRVVEDVRPFLEVPAEEDLLTESSLVQVLSRPN